MLKLKRYIFFFFTLFLSILLLSIGTISVYYHNSHICRRSSCPKVDLNNLNVHLIPHSHDDVGWLKTVDQYFYGWNNSIHKANVQKILDSVVNALSKNPERRFIYVETAYFWKWWQEKNETMRKKVRHLVNNGQLEITGGAWTMNDEAVTHYQSIIDQFTLGFRKLNTIFGKCTCPNVAWQIDTFGHSKEMASLFSQFGFDGLFMARIDYRDKQQRLKDKTAEMVWQASDNLGESSNLFTSVFFNHYNPPAGFCFDAKCWNRINDENEDYMATYFIQYAEKHAKHYKTNNIIVPMGDDFHYEDADKYFDDIDKLLHEIRLRKLNISVFYSTPSCYLKAVNDKNETWPVKSDDFFPYASDIKSIWTGFYTSRPALKRFERIGNNFLQVSKQLTALSVLKNTASKLDPLREAMGILQHHDAITGTEQQHVANDYARLLSEAIDTAEEVTNNALRQLSGQHNDFSFQNCLLLNISQCHISEDNDDFLVTVYNSLERRISHYVRIPVSKKEYKVYDLRGNEQEIQYVPIFEMIQEIPGRNSTAKGEIVFKAELIPSLGYKMYHIKYEPYTKVSNENLNKSSKINVEFTSTGHLKSISINNKTSIPLKQDFLYYIGGISSGAYIFSPEFESASIISDNVSVQKYAGTLVTEYHQTFNNWVGQIIRIYYDEEHVEFNWIVGPIFTKDFNGKEVISRFTTNLNNEGIFYTDSNGREMIKRIRNYRSNYEYDISQFTSQNYYPITSKILIKDKKQNLQLVIFNDRAQGGSNLRDGEIELMVHRRLLYDDGLGVQEPLIEDAYGKGLVVTGTHYVVLAPVTTKDTSSVLIEKELALKTVLTPWLFFTPLNENNDKQILTLKQEFLGLRKQLPKNIHILTLEPWGKDTFLLRFEHIFEKNENKKYSVPVKIKIENLFSTFHIIKIKEMSLGANQVQSRIKRMLWKTETDEQVNYNNNINKNEETYNPMEIILKPMQIKTFIVKIEPYVN